MAKISALELLTTADGDETIPVVKGGRTRRMVLKALAIAMTPFLTAYYKGDKGDPGGNPASIGLFQQASTLLIPVGTDMVQTTGHQLRGLGSARYVFDPAIGTPERDAQPQSVFISANGRGFRLNEEVARPEHYGARGDGATNDTVAFAAMAATIQAQGGGIIELRPVIYVVGNQRLNAPNGLNAFSGDKILTLTGLTKAFELRGNGATLKLFDGYRFGTFNRSGEPTQNPMPYTGYGERSFPTAGAGSDGVVTIANCSGSIKVESLTVDGNLRNATIGGTFGDTGWQLPGDGFLIADNTGGELIQNVKAVDCPRDGAMAWNTSSLGPIRTSRVMSSWFNFESRGNGRQGFSLVGGRNYQFENCKFHDTGRGKISSAPGAGFDLEAEVATIRDIVFRNCLFANNAGAQLVADSGDTEGVAFDDCDFIGVDSWSLWPFKPRMKFNRCRIFGALTHLYSDPSNPSRSSNFTNCVFSNDVIQVPYPTLFQGDAMLDLAGGGAGALFDRCAFFVVNLTNGEGLIFRDCHFTIYSPNGLGGGFSHRFEGRNYAAGPGTSPVTPSGPGSYGTNPQALFVEGAGEFFSKAVVYDPPQLAPNAQTSTVVKVQIVRAGDRVVATFDQPHAGVRIDATVITNATSYNPGEVEVVMRNVSSDPIDLPSGNLRVGVTSAAAL